MLVAQWISLGQLLYRLYCSSKNHVKVVMGCYSNIIIRQVQWDKDSDHQERVSPWEIDPSVSLPHLSVQSSPRLKKLRTSLQAPPNNPFTGMSLQIMDYVSSKSELLKLFF